MARIKPNITIRPVYFGMLLLSAVVMISAVRLTIASELDSLKETAEQGDITMQTFLGYMYYYGSGVPQNDAEAVRWYRMAAEQGDVDAQSILGLMYHTGRGVPKNDIEALRWFRIAAEQGDASAQFGLGLMYDTGRGVPKDYVQAYAWYNIAAAQGHEKAKEFLPEITKEMTTADITKAQELSREFWEAYGPNRASSE